MSRRQGTACTYREMAPAGKKEKKRKSGGFSGFDLKDFTSGRAGASLAHRERGPRIAHERESAPQSARPLRSESQTAAAESARPAGRRSGCTLGTPDVDLGPQAQMPATARESAHCMNEQCQTTESLRVSSVRVVCLSYELSGCSCVQSLYSL